MEVVLITMGFHTTMAMVVQDLNSNSELLMIYLGKKDMFSSLYYWNMRNVYADNRIQMNLEKVMLRNNEEIQQNAIRFCYEILVGTLENMVKINIRKFSSTLIFENSNQMYVNAYKLTRVQWIMY